MPQKHCKPQWPQTELGFLSIAEIVCRGAADDSDICVIVKSGDKQAHHDHPIAAEPQTFRRQ